MGKLKDIISGFTPSKVVAESAGTVVSNIMGGLDGLLTSKEEKLEMQTKIEAEINRHTEAVRNVDLEETKALLVDSANARDNNVKIQESEHASWLAKNTLYILTLIVTVGFFGLLTYMLKYDVPKSNEPILNIMLGSLGTAWITMVSFFFGSSISSKEKQKTINSILNGK